MAAAENAALPRGKVGGVGDVVRDLPPALAAAGCAVTVLTPEYGLFRSLPGAARVGDLQVPFAGSEHEVVVLELPSAAANVVCLVFQHARFSPAGNTIYNDDGAARPFATDAGKFAFFSACVACYVATAERQPDVVHLQDWHAALYLLLREYDPQFASLRSIHTVYTIHNLALQGIRPLSGDESSLSAWFPDLDVELASVVDPRYTDCINPMATAIRLADTVNTVSPTYAKEVLQANDIARGFRGGEGLEQDLKTIAASGRLHGILNGATYPERRYHKPSWKRLTAGLLKVLERARTDDTGDTPRHALAIERLRDLPTRKPRHVLTSIGRLTDQKASLLFQTTTRDRRAIDEILTLIANDGVLLVLGSGDPELEAALTNVSHEHGNLVFLCGYFDSVADKLYRAGDLFLMPSSFEPCGISQMLAMRAGQPCVVHAVGGLKDTVADGVNGFCFGGDTPSEQADNFVAAVTRALHWKRNRAADWRRLRRQAAAERFDWSKAAAHYIESVYAAN